MKILDIPQVGKLGLIVGQGGRYGQIRRSYVIPANPQTAPQMRVRGIFATNARRWDALTDAQRTAWTAAAATRQTATRGGTSGPMTGLQYFQRINATLLGFGQDQVDLPPATVVFGALAPQNLVVANTGGAITLKLTCPTSPGTNTVVSATAPVKAGVAINENYRIIGMCPTPAQGSADITSLYVARFGTPSPGTRIFVRVYQMSDGFQGVPAKFSSVVPASA